jgi:hypothetical protein
VPHGTDGAAALMHDAAATVGPAPERDVFDRVFTGHEDGPTPPAAVPDCTVVMVRGLFGAWIPGHFRAPLARLREAGWQATIARTDPAGTIEHNRQLLVRQVAALVDAGRRPLFLAHSKGGLEILLALAGEPRLAQATLGCVGVQVPRAGAPCLESMFHGRHRDSLRRGDRLREPVEAALLTLAGARGACRELDGPVIAPLAALLDRSGPRFPCLMVASCAQRPSLSLELRFGRLDRIEPGQPHDGVFFTRDQCWPGHAMLRLEGIDHSQPSIGGLGFAHDRFWPALLQAVLARR